jgi:FAD/FMN-containing dehydrogenase
VPGVGGAVVVDLSRMKRIIRIDPSNRVAIVEPGVTFGELQAALKKAGMCAYLPLVPRKSKSVIGSVLEREPITIPSHHWDATDPMLCVEVILGTGDRLRTGEAAGPDTLEQQWEIGKAQMSPFGPTQMDVHRLVSGAQGTIGIVTWMSLKCRSLPKLSRPFLIPSEDVAPLIDLSYKLVRARLGEHLFILNGLNLACLLGRTAQEIRKLRDILPPWVMFVSFEGYGNLPEEKVQYQEADLGEMARSGGLSPATDIPGASAEEVCRWLSQSSAEPYWKLRFKGGFQDIFFLTTLDKTPGFVTAMSALAQKHKYPVKAIGVYIQAAVQGTSCHCEFNLYYDPTKPIELDAARRLDGEVAGELEKMGAFFSRPYGAWADIAYRRAGDTAVMQRKIKKIFDPHGILNPGKLCF